MHIQKGYGKLLGSLLRFRKEAFFLHKQYGHFFRILHWCTDQAMTAALAQMELTAAQGQIMGYLVHQDGPRCHRDIEEAFRLSHPTVSGLLARLERKGFIALRSDPADRRRKLIELLPKGRQCQETMHQTILNIERQLVQDFSEEEKAQFSSFLERAIHNIHPNKEDSQ